jgi:hypothetical protein
MVYGPVGGGPGHVYTQDGGAHWKSQEYDGGDNDCSFTDPALPNWLLVFAPRGNLPHPTPNMNYWNNVRVYSTSAGNVPDALPPRR